jgi:hypothetical protein
VPGQKQDHESVIYQYLGRVRKKVFGNRYSVIGKISGNLREKKVFGFSMIVNGRLRDTPCNSVVKKAEVKIKNPKSKIRNQIKPLSAKL